MDGYEQMVDELLEQAVLDYRRTEEYYLWQEKLEQMDFDCTCMLSEREQEFAQECFALLLMASGAEQRFVYRRGLTDSIKLLKKLEVLS